MGILFEMYMGFRNYMKFTWEFYLKCTWEFYIKCAWKMYMGILEVRFISCKILNAHSVLNIQNSKSKN